MNVPENLKYTKDHEWLSVDGEIATVGITDFAQGNLGEIVFVDVDTVGEELDAGDVLGTIEAVKTTADLFLPVSGEIIEFNPEIDEEEGDNPSMINEDPYGKGWIVKVKMADKSELDGLLDYEAYNALIV